MTKNNTFRTTFRMVSDYVGLACVGYALIMGANELRNLAKDLWDAIPDEYEEIEK